MNEKDFEYLCHNDVILEFNRRLFSDILTKDNIISDKKAIKINKETVYGFFLKKGIKKYFMPADNLEFLPFKVVDETEIDYRGEVFSAILEIESVRIPAEKKLEFRDMVNSLLYFKHTDPKHFFLYKLIGIAAWIDRINVRVTTGKGFGKDSVVNILRDLVDTTANIYGATFAKLEYQLTKKFIVFNEMGNLKKEDKFNLQQFLLETGAFFSTYTKKTRKSAGTFEQYDVSDTSLMILYNLPSYYTNRNQEYFDQMFQQAVPNRFLPFVFDGYLTTDFGELIDKEEMLDKHTDLLKNIISTLTYYKENKIKNIKWVVPDEIRFGEDEKRYKRSFTVIMKYLAEWCRSQEEFDLLVKELYTCHKRYDKLISKERTVKLKEIK